jgi:hypothetical protein
VGAPLGLILGCGVENGAALGVRTGATLVMGLIAGGWGIATGALEGAMMGILVGALLVVFVLLGQVPHLKERQAAARA